MTFRPFEEAEVSAYFRSRITSVEAEISAAEPERILKASRTELEEYFISKVRVDPLILHHDRYYMADPRQTHVDVSHDGNRGIPKGEQVFVPGTKLQIEIPFEGDPCLWRLCPSRRYTGLFYSPIEISDDKVILTTSFPNDTADSKIIKNTLNVVIQRMAEMIAFQKIDVDKHNAAAPLVIKRAIQKKVEEAKAVADTIAGLGIPIKKRNEPLTYTLPLQRRQNPVKFPEVSKEPYRLEPVLEESEYAHILSVMRSMSLVIERNPHAFAYLDEEDIRTYFLLQLNGHYEGAASGETFNASGKTDILIRVKDRNCFIAECKFWKGPKGFDGAIDQLLSYLSWRDVKCALVVFNRNKNSTAVRAKMHEIMVGRKEHRKTVVHDAEGDSMYVYVKESDPGREIIITTQLYDMPCTKAE